MKLNLFSILAFTMLAFTLLFSISEVASASVTIEYIVASMEGAANPIESFYLNEKTLKLYFRNRDPVVLDRVSDTDGILKFQEMSKNIPSGTSKRKVGISVVLDPSALVGSQSVIQVQATLRQGNRWTPNSFRATKASVSFDEDIHYFTLPTTNVVDGERNKIERIVVLKDNKIRIHWYRKIWDPSYLQRAGFDSAGNLVYRGNDPAIIIRDQNDQGMEIVIHRGVLAGNAIVDFKVTRWLDGIKLVRKFPAAKLIECHDLLDI